MRLKVGAATDVGRVRPINEDAFLSRPEHGVFVVCDGMGGAASGEVASQLAIKTIADRLSVPAAGVAATTGYLARTERLGDSVRAANAAIWAQAQADTAHGGMGTTVVAALIDDHVVSLAHVGDSRAYLWHDGRLEAVTSDHSLVEAQVRAGVIDREQSLQSAHQNILLRALGRDADVEVELGEAVVSPGDCLVLCSDGLTRMVDDAALAQAVARFRGDPQAACAHLIAAANQQGGPDNITVVIVEVKKSGFFS
jgi:serine/threonine protein phosphatase PrpC